MREELKSIKYHAKNAKTQSFFRDAKSLRVSNLTQRAQRRKVFLEREEFKNLFFRGFILLKTLRLCVLCEKFFFNEDEY